MGFFQGRTTFLRFKVDGPAPRLFDDSALGRLAEFQAGRQKIASSDGVEVGWAAGDHILDVDFQLDKNVIDDMLSFDLRVDTEKLPTDLLRAYYATELKVLSKNNPSGLPSGKQKREAKEFAQGRLEDEGKDGRFKKRKAFPVVWDRKSNEVLFGSTSLTHVDRLVALFDQTFGIELDAITAGKRAYHLAEPHQQTRGVDDSSLSVFVPDITPADIVWLPDSDSRDFIGNEFLLWLWFLGEETDTVKAADGTEVTFMIARSMSLECPRGMTGHETITHEGPTRLPEAKRAIQGGKLPRKVGLTLVRHNFIYELTLHAETLAVGSAKMPAPPDEATDPRARLSARADQLRHLIETLDLLYDAFGRERFGKNWVDILPRMQRWLAREERRAG